MNLTSGSYDLVVVATDKNNVVSDSYQTVIAYDIELPKITITKLAEDAYTENMWVPSSFVITGTASGGTNDFLGILFGLGAAVLYATVTLLNKFIKPILKLLALPLTFMTFGLFGLVINGLILYMATIVLAPDFQIAGFGLCILTSIIVSVLYSILGLDK